MKQCHRLTRGSDFLRIRKQGRSWAHSIVVLSADRNDMECARFGFIVSRRIGNAVVRNHTKRQLREVVRHHWDEVPTGWDMVLVARAPITAVRFAEIDAAVEQLLRRARAWISEREATVKC